MGMTNLGIDLYVPENRYREAQKIIKTTSGKKEKLGQGEIKHRYEYQSKRRKRVWLLFFIIPLVMSMLVRVVQYFFGR